LVLCYKSSINIILTHHPLILRKNFHFFNKINMLTQKLAPVDGLF
jgi:hypothetical protein